MITNIFVQARMSSSRYPGKVLAPLQGKPLIKHIVERAEQVKKKNKVVVLTSTDCSDDPLVAYLESIGTLYFRGSLENVFERFQNCAGQYPSQYFVRLCADSPFIDPALIDSLLDYVQASEYDLISNACGRKFPKGQSVEIIKTKLFLNVNSITLSEHEQEHVMPYFYSHKNDYRSLFFDLTKSLGHINMCVDTLEDLKNLESSPYSYNFDNTKLCKTI